MSSQHATFFCLGKTSVCKTEEDEDVTLVKVSNFGDDKTDKKREISLIKTFPITY